jgi:Family of unknown function (DUF5330)
MFFLIRAAFWLTVVVMLLPGDPNSGANAPRVSAVEALVAARSAIVDISSFCDRNPDTCATGSTAAQVFVSKVRYGAEVISGYMGRNTGESDAGTLKQEDMAPSWRAPKGHSGAA